MTLSTETLQIDGQTLDPNITGSITNARLVRRYDGATRLDLTVYDPRMDILRSGALTRPGKPSKNQKQFQQAAWDRFATARLNLDGISFRLAGGGFRYDPATREITLSFEDELAVLMRLENKAVKVSRGQDTRAEFLRTLVRRSLAGADVPFTRAVADRYYSPQAGQREEIAEPKDDDDRQKGFGNRNFDIKTARATQEQKDNLAVALTEADRLRAGERATVALINAGITESRWINLTGGDADSSGVLQVQERTATTITPHTVIDPRSGNVRGSVAPRRVSRGALDPRDIREVTRIFLLKGFAAYQGGAIKYAADNPDAEPWRIAQAMQGSGTGAASAGEANYGPWSEQAKEILEAWGGAGQTYTVRESYEFRAGGRRNGSTQNYWDDSGDMAAEVRWRRFADRNRVWFVPDEWLFSRKPTFTITGEDGPAGLSTQGVISLDTTGFDIGLPVAEILLDVFLPRWGAAPGTVVEIVDMGALDGRWLVALNDMDLLPSPEIAKLTLVRPQPKKKEPAPKTNTVTRTESRPETGSVRDEIVKAAMKAYKLRDSYYYVQSRPMPGGLFENQPAEGTSGPARPMGIDCSAFVTLVYKAAGAPDPNGSGYNGQGYTGTLRANGKKTNDPQPGDLVHWGSGGAGGASHVGIYIGDGECVHHGSTPGPLKAKVTAVRNDLAGYWQHDLS